MSATFEAAAIEVQLDRPDAAYAPGDRLTASLEIAGYYAAQLSAVEVSIVWCTTGKGDEDLHVHEFARTPLAGAAPTPSRADSGVGDGSGSVDGPGSEDGGQETRRVSLSADLPRSPLSYAGRIVKVCWAVRVRLFHPGGRQSLIEAPFRLGAVAPAAPPADNDAQASASPPSRGAVA